MKDHNFIRISAICGILFPILAFALIILLGNLTPGYNYISDYISEIWATGSRFEFLSPVLLTFIGIMSIIFSIGLYLMIDEDKYSNYNFALLVVFSISLIFLGIFPCYGSCGGDQITLHLVFTIIACTSLGFSPLLLFFTTYKDKKWKDFEKNNLVFFFLSVIFLVLYAFFYQDYKGFFQRAYFLTCFLWIEKISIKLFKLSMVNKKSKERKK